MATTRVPSSSAVAGAARPIWRAQPLIAGALAGIAGGVVFGLMMQLMMPPMIGMIGALVGAPALGWVVHLAISAIIGAGFGLVLGRFVTHWMTALGLGAAYGFVWWILGPLLLMPTLMGMGPQFGMAFSGDMLVSLVGHLVFGVIAGAAFKAIAR